MSARINGVRAACLAAALGLSSAGLGAPAAAQAETPAAALPEDELDCLGVEASLRSTPASIPLGRSTTLSWEVTGPRLCIRGLTIENRAVANNGSMTVTPTVSRSYSLLMTINKQRAVVATTRVTVTLPIPPDNGTPAVVSINGSTGAWKNLLVAALQRPNTTIRLAETVDMDLTEFPAIYVFGGINLTGDQPLTRQTAKAVPGVQLTVPGRSAQKLGPRLYTRRAGVSLFILRCSATDGILDDKLRFSGFRLHGPHFGTEKGESNLDRGIRIQGCRGVDISNMELAGWSGSAVMVEGTEGIPQDSYDGFDEIRIRDNFIHHNQHEGDNGYGVAIQDGSWARIERNVFDHNRHAIKASGTIGTSYFAADNLVLKGGGYHQNYPGYTAYTHQFDVHGDANCRPGNHQWDCGNAGDTFWYVRNAFQYTKGDAIKVRGRPRNKAYVNNNAFRHASVDAAVDGGGFENIKVGSGVLANVAGVESYGRYGVCDLDGDGRDDLLMLTGATWWYASAGNLHWVYLRQATDRIDAVRLGNFDADPRCDVLRKSGSTLQISSGARGAWTALPGSYPYALADLRFADFNADGRTDIFRRAATTAGEWYVVSPGVHPWRLLGSSTQPLSGLYFGDFDGDDIADILKRSSSTWSISKNGTASWEPFNGNLGVGASHQLFIADIDNNGRDDIVRFRPTSASVAGGAFDVSRDGRGGWTLVAEVASPMAPPDEPRQMATVPTAAFVGRFDAAPGADPLFLDKYRYSHVVNGVTRTVSRHGAYPY